MPQPATHYLVTRFSIPSDYYAEWWDAFKPYFGLGSCAPDFFYFPLVPLTTKGLRNDLSWGDIANPLHSNNSYDMFCNLLDTAKENKNNAKNTLEQINAKKQFAFSFGYYCHVVTDCIFHPYVYRSTGDLWHTVDKIKEGVHKKQEIYIDNELYKRYYPKETNIQKMSVECPNGASLLLDFSIANFFNAALSKTYSDCLPNIEYSPEDEFHPIQQAYKALIHTLPVLFEGKEICLWGSKIKINIDIQELVDLFNNNFLTAPYKNVPTLPSHTPDELFKFSIVECYNIFNKIVVFWNSDETSVRNFFERNRANYLAAGNFNLDTGLPSCFNNYKMLRVTDPEKHYSFMAETLTNNYKYFEEDFQQFDKSILKNKQLLK